MPAPRLQSSSLEEGITIINKRQKIIKIADKNGWDVPSMSISAMILLLILMMISVCPKPYDKLITNVERMRKIAENGTRIGFVFDPHLTSSTLAPQHLQHPPLSVFSIDKTEEVQAVLN